MVLKVVKVPRIGMLAAVGVLVFVSTTGILVHPRLFCTANNICGPDPCCSWLATI